MRFVIGAAAMLALSAPAHAEVIAKTETGFVTRTTAAVSKTPMETWDVLIVPAKWWDKTHTWSGDSANLSLDPRASGCFCEVLPPPPGVPPHSRAGSVEHMRVIHANPGKVLRLSGGLGPLQGEGVQGTLTITLKPIDGGTRILFEYVVGGYMRFRTDQIAPAVDGVLREQLLRLAEVAGPLAVPTPASELTEPGR